MNAVTIIREVPASCLRWKAGPWVGMAALQAALQKQGFSWMRFAKRPDTDSIPWFWCWMDTASMRAWANSGKPFIVGPNLYPDHVFGRSNCLLSHVHSLHQRDWIERKSGGDLPTIMWPYPIDPLPPGPIDRTESDVLVYLKKRTAANVIRVLQSRWKTRVMKYGQHDRPMLFDAASRSRCCLYWSKWDTGSLVQAETMLAGCPNVGSRTGSPWIEDGVNGAILESWSADDVCRSIERVLLLDRQAISRWARQKFSVDAILGTIITGLKAVAAQTCV